MRPDRRIPGWAAGLLARLARDRPAVVTREDVEADLTEAGSSRAVDPTVRELQRLGWFKPLHVKGAWAYVPPGEEEVIDPYIDLRGWKARDPEAVFALAGEAAAWHLGYFNRAFSGPVTVWIPANGRPPHGLRTHLSIVTLGRGVDDGPRLGPTTALLHRRRLDTRAWAGGLPGFGPEALRQTDVVPRVGTPGPTSGAGRRRLRRGATCQPARQAVVVGVAARCLPSARWETPRRRN